MSGEAADQELIGVEDTMRLVAAISSGYNALRRWHGHTAVTYRITGQKAAELSQSKPCSLKSRARRAFDHAKRVLHLNVGESEVDRHPE